MKHRFLSLPLVGLLVVMLATITASRGIVAFSTGLAGIVSGILVLIASYDHDYILPSSRFKTAMVWLGSRSYSIYLIHVTCHSAVMEFKRSAGLPEGGRASQLLTLACLPLILILAEMNYRGVETPFRRLGRRIADGLGRKFDQGQLTEAPELVAE
jgi:peptidoglycan/LPS O-acetylase OafA/YrhL